MPCDRAPGRGLRDAQEGKRVAAEEGAMLRDLHDLYLMATECEITWTLAAQGARDADLLATAERCQGEISGQLSWLRTRMKQAAPQALVVAD